jgi:thioredoxin 1
MKFWTSIPIFLAIWMMSCANGSSQTSNNQPHKVDAPTFAQLIQQNPAAQIIDVRTPQEFEGGYIAGAMNLDYNGDDYSRQVAALEKGKMVLIYCLSGGRSGSAADEMRKNGFEQVIELNGGTLNWKKANLPLIQSAVKKQGISLEEFQQSLNAETIHLIDFYAPWCAPCKRMAPMLEELEKQYQGKVKIHRINIDENETLANEFKITTLPTLKVFRSGKEVWSYEGVVEKVVIESQLHP